MTHSLRPISLSDRKGSLPKLSEADDDSFAVEKIIDLDTSEAQAASTKVVAADRADASVFAEYAAYGDMPKTGDVPMGVAAGIASIASALAALAVRLRLRRDEER